MSRVATEDSQMISHIEYTCNSIHDFGDELYEDLMDRDHKEATRKAQDLMKLLSDLIQSMADEI